MVLRYFLCLIFLLMLSKSFVDADNVENDLHLSDDGERSLSDLELEIIDPSYFDISEEATATKKEDATAEELEEPIMMAKKAPCLGCPEMIDTKNDKIQEMAIFAFGDYMDRDQASATDDQAMQTLIRVLKAERQIVAGIKYILEVEMGWSNCTKSHYQQSPEDCTSDTSRPTFICDFHVVEKSWEQSKELVYGQCKNEVELSKADITENEGVAPTQDDDDDLFDEIVTDEEGGTSRKKREAGLVGEIREAKEDKKTLMSIAEFAVEQLDKVDEDNNARLVVDILNANKQTVSGWLYELKIRVAETSCEENTGATLEKCQDKITLPFQRCEVKVLFQPWQTVQKKLVHSQCYRENYRTGKKIAKQLFGTFIGDKKRSAKVVGGSKVIDPESEDIAELVNFAIDSVDGMSNALHAQKLVRVVYAERKLVAGISTKLVLELGYTNCRKNPTLDKSTCSIDEERNHQFCNVTIIQKVWLNETKMASFKCGKKEEVMEARRKREVTLADSSVLDEDELEFGRFIDTFDKNYNTEAEYKYRLGIFKENIEKVKLLQKTERGTAIYGATMFADLTEDEFSNRHLGLRPDLRERMKTKQTKIPMLRTLPDGFDWRDFNAVTPVKNQGMCGSCWAFSVTGNIEGVYKIKHGELLSFSEQELVDCDTLDEGCKGGLPENAYKALEKLGGLETETDYPYDGRDEKCQFNSTRTAAKVTGFIEVSKNETEMAAWLVKNGPISIGINANAMQFYFGGVSHPWKFLCSPKSLDHGVLIVGFGVHTSSIRHKTLPYWIVKNSWGSSWGEKGYYRIFRGDGSCGLNQMTTSASVA